MAMARSSHALIFVSSPLAPPSIPSTHRNIPRVEFGPLLGERAHGLLGEVRGRPDEAAHGERNKEAACRPNREGKGTGLGRVEPSPQCCWATARAGRPCTPCHSLVPASWTLTAGKLIPSLSIVPQSNKQEREEPQVMAGMVGVTGAAAMGWGVSTCTHKGG